MSMEMSEFHEAFFEECRDHLKDMEQTLLSLTFPQPKKEDIHILFRAVHSIKGGSGIFGITPIAELGHAMESLLAKVRNDKLALTESMVTVLLQCGDELHRIVDSYYTPTEDAVVPDANLISQLKAFTGSDLPETAPIIPTFGPIDDSLDEPVEPDDEAMTMPLFAPLDEDAPPEKSQNDKEETSPAISDSNVAPQQPSVSTLRVRTDKIDSVMNQLGELVISQSVLQGFSEHAVGPHAEAFEQALDTLSQQLRQLQVSVMGIRMLPVSTLFKRFNRVVRDVAMAADKEVELVFHGLETEIDKTMIEKLTDPLTHLVRNAVDHGIETPEQRRIAGKPEKGKLMLSAYQQGGMITLSISDDGAGLNRDRIIERAREQGLSVQTNAPDQVVWNLIFKPGFSTAKTVSSLSGRGVGMDVVKRNLDDLGGSINITSHKGKGTTMAIVLPLTLAILDGMLVGVDDQIFILPLLSIVESFQPQQEHIKFLGEQPLIFVQGLYWPVYTLSRNADTVPSAETWEGYIVVLLKTATSRVALLVDRLIGHQQVVIKSIDKHYKPVRNVAAATILGNGELGLILDVEQLCSQFELPEITRS